MAMKCFLIAILFIGVITISYSQTAPSALGDIHLAKSLSVGINQDVKSNFGNWKYFSYISNSWFSKSENDGFFDKQGIFIYENEMKNKMSNQNEISFGTSYRNQNVYTQNINSDKLIKQEFRFYSRYSYNLKISKMDLSISLKQEFNKYFTENFKSYSESLRIRPRFRIKISLPIDKIANHKISLFSEQLFSTSLTNTSKWSKFQYNDSRFSIFYTYTNQKIKYNLSVGYMYNLIGIDEFKDGNYLTLNLIFKNPFSTKK